MSMANDAKPGAKPHHATIDTAAKALGIAPRQLLALYDDDPSTTPAGWMPVDAGNTHTQHLKLTGKGGHPASTPLQEYELSSCL